MKFFTSFSKNTINAYQIAGALIVIKLMFETEISLIGLISLGFGIILISIPYESRNIK